MLSSFAVARLCRQKPTRGQASAMLPLSFTGRNFHVKSISSEDQLGKIIAHLYLWSFHPLRPHSGHNLELYFKQHRIQLPSRHNSKGVGICKFPCPHKLCVLLRLPEPRALSAA